MQTDKWKTRQIVIERDFGVPTGFVVAGGAVLSERTLVGVLPSVAAVALRGNFYIVDIAAMAAPALGFFMRTVQGELGISIMIEADLFPLD